MDIQKKYITNNRHYKGNVIIKVNKLILHSVGTPQPSVDVFFNIWNKESTKYLTQVIVGPSSAYEVLPCMSIKGKAVFCYHAGDVNKESIGVEMTEPSTIRYIKGATWKDLDPAKTKSHVLATYNNAVDIFSQLCKFHDLDPLTDGVILSHSECYKRGIGTNHADVEHIWSKFGLSMNQFRQDVANRMFNTSFKPYLVKVTDSELNVRRGPSIEYPIETVIKDKGVYTIIEEKGNWGKLKSKVGWINLKYTRKI